MRDGLFGQFPGSVVVGDVSVVCTQWVGIPKMAKDAGSMVAGVSRGIRGGTGDD